MLLRKSVIDFCLKVFRVCFTTQLVTLEKVVVNLISTEVTVLWITSKLLMPFINPCNQGMYSVTKMDAVETGCRNRLGTCRQWM